MDKVQKPICLIQHPSSEPYRIYNPKGFARTKMGKVFLVRGPLERAQ
jgi:hypothetical protein